MHQNTWSISIGFLRSRFPFNLTGVRIKTIDVDVPPHRGSGILGKIVRNNLSISVMSRTLLSIKNHGALHEWDFFAISDCAEPSGT